MPLSCLLVSLGLYLTTALPVGTFLKSAAEIVVLCTSRRTLGRSPFTPHLTLLDQMKPTTGRATTSLREGLWRLGTSRRAVDLHGLAAWVRD